MSAHTIRGVRLVALAMTILSMVFVPGRVRAQISPGPLTRAHAAFEGATNCAKCHGLRREPMSQLCLGCHRDVQWGIDQGRGLHAREVRQGKKECASCHPDHAGQSFALIAWAEGSSAKFDHARAGWTLEGKHAATKCESCHTTEFRVSPAAALSKRKTGAGWLGLETSCVSCHRADDPHKNALGEACGSCHTAADWKPAPKFDHAASQYPLTGQHVDVACDKCHLAPRLGIRPNAKGERVALFKPLAFRECSSCHTDPHNGRLSAQCSACHVTRGFGAIDKRGFDHARTRYPLAGKHRTVSCDACHGANMSKPNPPFATCANCHADTHRGEAMLAGKPADCGACHQVQGFAPSTYTVAQHTSAAFRLTGKHAQVPCASCHTPFIPALGALRVAKAVRLRPRSATCGDCHADVHGGQLAGRSDNATCATCHSDAGWKPSTFAAAAHAKLRVTLEGRHGAIPCASCHALARPGLTSIAQTTVLGSARVLLKVPETECVSCHADPHAGRYNAGGALALAGGCRACHDSRGFRPALVDVDKHAQFTFPLAGAHRAAPCVACHAEMRVAPATSTLLLSAKGVASLPFTARRATNCQSCHESPHGTQFAARKDRGTCEGCHGVEAFAPASLFDHQRDATFSLSGAHASVACAGCHKPGTGSSGPKSVMYRGLSHKCETCHTAKRAGGNG